MGGFELSANLWAKLFLAGLLTGAGWITYSVFFAEKVVPARPDCCEPKKGCCSGKGKKVANPDCKCPDCFGGCGIGKCKCDPVQCMWVPTGCAADCPGR